MPFGYAAQRESPLHLPTALGTSIHSLYLDRPCRRTAELTRAAKRRRVERNVRLRLARQNLSRGASFNLDSSQDMD
jgi:hypothetical protein